MKKSVWGILLGLPLGVATLGVLAEAAAGASPKPPSQHQHVRAATPTVCWRVLETPNFRILSYDAHPVRAEVGRQCEALRRDLASKWLIGPTTADWSPKCDVVLHPNDASYLKEVGAGASNTLASSLVDQKRGQVNVRRIDVRSADAEWQTAALPHELTHVILAGHFAGRTIPRWIDEGVAILADPTDKRQRHEAELLAAIADRSAFRMVELINLDDYPAANRWGAFYAQSASIVEFLVAEESPATFVRFVQVAMNQGYDSALRDVYQIGGVAELERLWNAKAGHHVGRTVKAGGPTGLLALQTQPRPKRSPAAAAGGKFVLTGRNRP